MSGHGSHAILVLPIPFEVSNRPNATWIHVTNKMPSTFFIRISYKLNVCFVVVVSWDCHSYHGIEFNGMCLV